MRRWAHGYYLGVLTSDDVPLTQSALLVIDAQDSFRVRPYWSKRNNPDFERNVGALIAAYRAAQLPVVFFLHSDGDEGFTLDSPHYRLMDSIERLPNEPLLHKTTRNVFTSTNLQPWLLERGIRRVAITGIQTEQCCETSARVAADLGFAVDFVMDATMTFPIPDWDQPGRELGVDAIVERTTFALRRRFARIACTERLMEELRAM